MSDAPRPEDPPETETAPADEAPTDEPLAQAVLRRAAAGAADVVDTVTGTPEALYDLTEAVVQHVQRMADAAVEQWRNREAARIRHLRSLN